MAVTFNKQTSILSEVRLLLVDPDKTNRSILSRLIEDMKPDRFMMAKSIAEARLALASRVDQFDVILLAIKNPPTSGFHFLQEIRVGGISRVPRGSLVILISQPPNRTMLELAGSLDADGFLALPMSAATVTNALSKALKREHDTKAPEDYLAVNLPNPVRKKPKKDDANPNAWVVWSQKEKEKAEFLRSLKNILKEVKEEETVGPEKIENVHTFWLKDLRSGMILAEDIKGENDELLLATGTSLNDALIEKIKKFSEFGLCRSFLEAGSAPGG